MKQPIVLQRGFSEEEERKKEEATPIKDAELAPGEDEKVGQVEDVEFLDEEQVKKKDVSFNVVETKKTMKLTKVQEFILHVIEYCQRHHLYRNEDHKGYCKLVPGINGSIERENIGTLHHLVASSILPRSVYTEPWRSQTSLIKRIQQVVEYLESCQDLEFQTVNVSMYQNEVKSPF